MKMRYASSVVWIAALAVCAPVAAQTLGAVEQRLSKLESTVESIERKLGRRGGASSDAAAASAGSRSSAANAEEFSRRLDALEKQLALLVSQSEETGFAVRRLVQDQGKSKADTDLRLLAMEEQAAATSAALKVLQAHRAAETVAVGSSKSQAAATNPVDADFAAARAFADAGEWNKAEFAFSAFLATYGNSPKAAQARYWQGRSFLAEGRAGDAAKSFLDVFQTWPKDPVVLDSLYGLGTALMKMQPANPVQACAVYDQIEDLFAASLSPAQVKSLRDDRIAANCQSR